MVLVWVNVVYAVGLCTLLFVYPQSFVKSMHFVYGDTGKFNKIVWFDLLVGVPCVFYLVYTHLNSTYLWMYIVSEVVCYAFAVIHILCERYDKRKASML
jgi:hypothetical protein